MKKIYVFLTVFMSAIIMLNANPSNRYITEHSCSKAKAAILRKGCTISDKLIDRGLSQAAAFWTSADGSQDEFVEFCTKNFCMNLEEKDQLFERLCTNFETILGHNNRVTIELLRPSHVKGYESLPIDDIFGAYNGLAHFNADMFSNKIAFIVIMNFPHFTLREKVNNGENWTIRQWAMYDWVMYSPTAHPHPPSSRLAPPPPPPKTTSPTTIYIWAWFGVTRTSVTGLPMCN